MTFIDTPSPNHDERTLPISLVVLHYTGMETGADALARMRDKDAKVSAHYMAEEDGRVYKLVDENRRAWHAGVSAWSGETNINSASIGIEIVNGGHDFGLPAFPDAQIKAVIKLCQDIKARHGLSDYAFVGHSDIAPARKQDPGEKFPWDVLADNNVGIWPDIKTGDRRMLFAKNDRGRGVSAVQSGLAYLGYDIEVSGVMDDKTVLVCAAFQRRYRPAKIDGQIDVQMMEILKLLAEVKKKHQ